MTVRGWAGDLRHSARALTQSPGFTLLTIMTFAIGIGAPAAIFSLAEAALLRPLPMEDGERLVRIYTTKDGNRFSVSYPDFEDFTSRTDLFASASFYRSGGRDVSDGEDAERIAVTWVHEDFFQTLGTQPVVGRVFTQDDHDAAALATLVLAEDFWNRRFGGDVNLIGQTIRLDGTPHTVIGIVARDSAWPADAQAWTPLLWGGQVPAADRRRSNHSWNVIARVQPGVRIGDASAQVRDMARQIYAADDIDERDAGFEALVMGLGPSRTPDEAVAAFGVMGVAVLLVLLVACVNASGLLLSRASLRVREISLRATLGASRARLVWMLLGESMLLAVAGGATGLIVAYLGLREVLRSAPGGLDRLLQVQLNWSVLLAAFAISLLAALLAGLAPALRAGRISVAEAIKDGGAQVGEGRRDSRLRRNLVVVELALTLALLLAAGLAIQGFQKQIAGDPGFETDNLLSFTVRLPAARYETSVEVGEYHRQALAALERHPSIAAATATSRLPLGAGGLGLRRAFIFDGATEPPDGETFDADWIEVDASYFSTLAIRPIAGRPFTDADAADTELVAIVHREQSDGPADVARRIDHRQADSIGL